MSSRPLQLRRRSKPSLGTRFRTYWIVALILAALAVYGGWALASAPIFRAAHVDVTGTTRVSPADVLARAALNPNANIWLSNMGAAEARIRDIPYVLSAHVSRHFPGAVSIAIVERTPEACLRDARGTQRTVDSELRELESGCASSLPTTYLTKSTLDAKPGDYITDQQATQVRHDAQTLASLAAADAASVASGLPPAQRYTSFSIDPNAQLEATMSSGIRVRFGDDDDLELKERLIGPILQSLGSRAATLRAIDVRAPATPVVEFR